MFHEPENGIIFHAPNNVEVIRLENGNFYYKGKMVADTEEAYKRFCEWLQDAESGNGVPKPRREEVRMILDLVLQGCVCEDLPNGSVLIDNMCMSTYEEATSYLVDCGILKDTPRERGQGRFYIYTPEV